MSLGKALFKNLLASGWGKASTVIFRLVQVPIMLVMLGVTEYGIWLVLYSFPSWIALTSLGFGSVAGNEISMAMSKEDLPHARKIFSTTLTIVTAILVGGVVLLTPFAFLFHWENFLKIGAERHMEIGFALTWFILSTFLSFYCEVYQARFRAGFKPYLFTYYSSFRPWLELLLMVVVLQFTKRFDYLAACVLVATILFLLATLFRSRRLVPSLTFSFRDYSKDNIRFLFQKGIAFQAFPLGNALLYQGNIIVVQIILGPVAVAIFGSVRTLVRSINQMLELINQVLWPEVSVLFGKKDYHALARLHRVGVVASIGLALICTIVLFVFGHYIFLAWTHGEINVSTRLLFFFLIPIPFNSLWFTSSVMHMASNKHEGLAIRYLTAMAVSVGASALLTHFFGLEGAAISTMVSDLILIPYVFVVSLQLTNDTYSNFIKQSIRDIRTGTRVLFTNPQQLKSLIFKRK